LNPIRDIAFFGGKICSTVTQLTFLDGKVTYRNEVE